MMFLPIPVILVMSNTLLPIMIIPPVMPLSIPLPIVPNMPKESAVSAVPMDSINLKLTVLPLLLPIV